MAITVKGVDSTFELTHFDQIQEAQSLAAPARDGVLSGFAVSVTTGTRLLSVSAGSAVAPGVLVASTAAESVTLDANTSGSPRIDVIVLEVNWSGTSTTAGDVKFVKGTPGASPVAPTLTRTAGVLWQIPLAYVTVANAASQLVAGNVERSYKEVDTGDIALTLAAGYTQSGSPLSVRRRNGMVELGGNFAPNSNVAVGASVALTTLSPAFRPSRLTAFTAVADVSGSPRVVAFLVTAGGAVTLYPVTGTVASGASIRPLATWLSEV